MQTNIVSNPGCDDIVHAGPFAITFPRERLLDQDEEWCQVRVEGEWKKIRFHDYQDIFKIPGLYETIFYRTLRCHSPSIVVNSLRDTLLDNKIPLQDLRVLDFGAGNGMVGEALQTAGAGRILGVDILEEARDAATRDRPWVYDKYVVADFTKLTDAQTSSFEDFRPNALVVVAALGFGDIPPDAFLRALDFVEHDGWLAFNIRERFLRAKEGNTFASTIKSLFDAGVLELHSYKRSRHRYNIAGQPLYYATLVARKVKKR